MFSVDPRTLVHLGQDSEGSTFTSMVDAVIRGTAYLYSLPQDRIKTNLRTSIGDGGVDTQVDDPIPHGPSNPFGWMDSPTVWQYKATPINTATKKLATEVAKPYVKEKILQGYAYRLCICDEAPPQSRTKYEKKLNELIKAVSEQALPAKIILVSDIAEWMSSFPSLVLRFLNSGIAMHAQHLEAWSHNAISRTNKYVHVPNWSQTTENLAKHLDWSEVVPNVVFPLQGKSGVGKTRLVYETTSKIPGADSLVVYTADEAHALKIANSVANDSRSRAILVADECGVSVREQIRTVLQGHRSRVRVVAIDNSSRLAGTAQPESVIQHMSDEILEAILQENFPYIPHERRRMYSAISKGFVRIAAELCVSDPSIVAVGHVGPTLDTLTSWVTGSLSDEDLSYIQAISLVRKVGFSGDISEEIERLCEYLGLDSGRLRQAVSRLHSAPGFIARAGHHLYVTPELIAQIALDGAWDRWAKFDQADFIKRFPAILQEAFIDRIQRSGSDEVRRAISATFRSWIVTLETTDLSSVETMDRVSSLVETDPETYFPILRALIRRSSRDELLAILGDPDNGKWGPRRTLVWLAERFVAFPIFFEDAELILRSLSLAESEPDLGNNATSIWRQIFRIALSGTALPFEERLGKLQSLLLDADDNVSRLAFTALEECLSMQSGRFLTAPVVAGRIPPTEWRPKTNPEYLNAQQAALDLMITLAEGGPRQHEALNYLIDHCRLMLHMGMLDRLKPIFKMFSLTDNQWVTLRSNIDEFLQFDIGSNQGKTFQKLYVEAVQNWHRSLVPTGLHGRVIAVTGVRPYFHAVRGGEDEWKNELKLVANELFLNPTQLDRSFPWLLSATAQSSGLLGQEIGVLDAKAQLLCEIFKQSTSVRSSTFARGYLSGLLSHHAVIGEINILLDEIEKEDPMLAFDFFIVGIEPLQAVERSLKLLKSKQIPSHFFRAFAYGDSPSPDDISQILGNLLIQAELDDEQALSTALEIVASRIIHGKHENQKLLTDNSSQLVTLLKLSLTASGVAQDHYWAEILKAIANVEPTEAASIAASSMVAKSFSYSPGSEQAVALVARENPELFLNSLKLVLDQEQHRWRFYVGDFGSVINSIPEGALITWLKESRVEIAQCIARHVPPPFINGSGEPTVPKVTEFLLTFFEDDDRVFNEFSAGVHNMQMYVGDIAAQHDAEAAVAQKFLAHPLRRIREWALREESGSLSQASYWRQHDEEQAIR